MTTRTKRPIRAEQSSGNVFADLGIPHPEQELLKARLTLKIYRLIKERGLTQAAAGKILGIKQPNVSALMRNRSGSFSREKYPSSSPEPPSTIHPVFSGPEDIDGRMRLSAMQ